MTPPAGAAAPVPSKRRHFGGTSEIIRRHRSQCLARVRNFDPRKFSWNRLRPGLLAQDCNSPARHRIGHKLVTVRFLPVYGDKQRARSHFAAVVGDLRDPQIAVLRCPIRLDAPQQSHQPDWIAACVGQFLLRCSFAVFYRPHRLHAQRAPLRAAADTTEESRAKRTVMRLPRRIVAPDSGDCSTATPVPTNTGLNPSFIHCSFTSRTVSPWSCATITPSPSASSMVVAAIPRACSDSAGTSSIAAAPASTWTGLKSVTSDKS